MPNPENLKPFEKGQPRPANAGRKKNTRNKLTELKAAVEVMKELGIDPTEELIKLHDKTTDPDLKYKILSELHKYKESYKQKTDIDIKGHIDGLFITEWKPDASKGGSSPNPDPNPPRQ